MYFVHQWSIDCNYITRELRINISTFRSNIFLRRNSFTMGKVSVTKYNEPAPQMVYQIYKLINV